jgi:hypothetical protein
MIRLVGFYLLRLVELLLLFRCLDFFRRLIATRGDKILMLLGDEPGESPVNRRVFGYL